MSDYKIKTVESRAAPKAGTVGDMDPADRIRLFAEIRRQLEERSRNNPAPVAPQYPGPINPNSGTRPLTLFERQLEQLRELLARRNQG